MNEPVCKTHVYHEGKCWFVSTINRECSAVGAHGMRYHETLVWAWDIEKRERISDKILFQGEGWECHFKVVKSLMYTGELPKDDE